MSMRSFSAGPLLPLASPCSRYAERAFAAKAVAVAVHARRPFSLSSCRMQTSEAPAADSQQKISLRWIGQVKERIGKCITFGLDAQQVQRAGQILETLTKEWRELSVGSQGFLTGRGMAGLLKQRVVWGEMDSMGHVNNVTYVRYAESARMQLLKNFATHIDPAHRKEWSEMSTSKGSGLILREIAISYKFPMTWPDRISVFHKLSRAPVNDSDSFDLDVLIMSECRQRPAASCKEKITMYDYRQGKKMALPPFMIQCFAETFEQQEAAKKENMAKILALLDQVTALEKDSWDRSDAKEDFGSAQT